MRGVYDSKGKLSRLDVFNANDSLADYYVINELSTKGDIQLAQHFNGAGALMETYCNLYDEFTRLYASSTDRFGKATFISRVIIDSNKWPINEVIENYVNNKLIVDSLQYQYDSVDHHGNWQIKRIKNYKNLPLKIVRQIYYD